MLTASDYTYEAHALTEEEAEWVDEARGMLREIVEEREIMALVYLEDTYQVRSEADVSSAEVATVYSGHTVYIEDVTIDDDYKLAGDFKEQWRQVGNAVPTKLAYIFAKEILKYL